MDNMYRSKNLDHLGIVSQICDEIGIVEMIDKILPPDPSMKISHGECVKLMVINGLGFTSRPLYLEAQFFSSRPVDRFLLKDCENDGYLSILSRHTYAKRKHLEGKFKKSMSNKRVN